MVWKPQYQPSWVIDLPTSSWSLTLELASRKRRGPRDASIAFKVSVPRAISHCAPGKPSTAHPLDGNSLALFQVVSCSLESLYFICRL
jgi:hypothetical protein